MPVDPTGWVTTQSGMMRCHGSCASILDHFGRHTHCTLQGHGVGRVVMNVPPGWDPRAQTPHQAILLPSDKPQSDIQVVVELLQRLPQGENSPVPGAPPGFHILY